MPSERVRLWSGHVLNPLVRRWAGTAWSPFALLIHRGRRSGRTYATPLLVRRLADGWTIALTYGEITDWYRNLVAAGQGRLRLHGREVVVSQPRVIARVEALPAFSWPERVIIRRVGITQFVHIAEGPISSA